MPPMRGAKRNRQEKRQKQLLVFAPFLQVFLKNGGVSLCYERGERRMREMESGKMLATESGMMCGTEDTMTRSAEGAGSFYMDGFDYAMEAFLPDVMKRFCPECGAAVQRNTKGRPRKFCSTACCNAWWQKHPKPEHWSSAQKKTCPMCGREFLSGREAYRPRTYCSRACANRGRAAERIMPNEPAQSSTEMGT